MKLILAILFIIILSGCTTSLFNKNKSLSALDNCLSPDYSDKLNNQCNLMPWIDYWMQASTLNWKERKQRLDKLTNTSEDRVKIVLLSNVPNTPYQSRLRAQLVAQQFIQNNTSELARFINLIIFLPAQEKLKLESALTTQTQFNIGQEKKLQEHRKHLSEQTHQINQLLEIEKNIIEKPIINTPIEVTP